ncbi:hypothetical protein BVG16_21700 [Paenibacillus selenitireducens]|uniref:N-acetyltransferase domain-containing protein n=2 Tax=Paenibacillus selenitireducens TaxID=1324314 RepID=A0A1T2X665_9BACL|nr:hypothetical protein BVG16_21700 [Paenibacillus selenitireducens]
MTERNSIFELLQQCTHHMIEQGIYQWDDVYPAIDDVTMDIESCTLFCCRDLEYNIAGVITLNDMQPDEYANLHWNDPLKTKVLTIHRLAVHPLHQGRGIAQQLMAFTEAYAREQGYTSIRLDCFSQNPRAYNLYHQLGYDLRGEVIFPHSTIPFYCFEKVIIPEEKVIF